jgi:hypothetical protein
VRTITSCCTVYFLLETSTKSGVMSFTGGMTIDLVSYDYEALSELLLLNVALS